MCSNVDVMGRAVCSEESAHVLCACVDMKRQEEPEELRRTWVNVPCCFLYSEV